MHTWYVEGIALKIVDGFWTTTRIVANPISLRYFSIFTFFSNDYSSVTFPFLRNIILEFLFFFVPFSFFFLFDLARIVRPREIPPQFVAPSTDSSTNLNARADRRSTGPVYHPAQRRVLSGSVSYRVGRARPFMPTDFQTRTERAPTYTTRACAWTKMAVVQRVLRNPSASPLFFSRKSLGNKYNNNSPHDFDRSFDRWREK